jgi:hypothetical protein
MRPSDRAWLVLAGSVAVWDAVCDDGEMLSQASARYRVSHPVLWPAVIIYLAAHLCHVVPHRVDPLSRLAAALGR